MLDAINIKKSIGEKTNAVEILHGVSLSVADGEMLAIMGPSGCGKSTILGIMAGLDAPTSGVVTLDGQDIYAMPEKQREDFRRKSFSVVFQSQNLVGELTCVQNVSIPQVFGRESAKRGLGQTPSDCLKLVGLAGKENLYPFQLSGGEQQRAGIARALLSNPKVLFTDEPTGALDQANSRAIIQLLRESSKRFHFSIVLVTHDPDVASQCDRIVRMLDGRIEE